MELDDLINGPFGRREENYEDSRITVNWWQKDGAWHYAIREEPDGPKLWQAPDDAEYGGYDTLGEARNAARKVIKERGW